MHYLLLHPRIWSGHHAPPPLVWECGWHQSVLWLLASRTKGTERSRQSRIGQRHSRWAGSHRLIFGTEQRDVALANSIRCVRARRGGQVPTTWRAYSVSVDLQSWGKRGGTWMAKTAKTLKRAVAELCESRKRRARQAMQVRLVWPRYRRFHGHGCWVVRANHETCDAGCRAGSSISPSNHQY